MLIFSKAKNILSPYITPLKVSTGPALLQLRPTSRPNEVKRLKCRENHNI